MNKIKDGNRNTMFFHCKASQQKNNFIRGPFDGSGYWHEEDDDLEGVVSEYFSSLFSSSSPSKDARQEVLYDVSPVITE